MIIRQRTWNGKGFISWMVDLSEFSSLLDMLSFWTCMSSYKGTTKGQHFLFKLFFFVVLPENGILKRSPTYWLITESILNPPKNSCCINMSKKNTYDSIKINQGHIHKTLTKVALQIQIIIKEQDMQATQYPTIKMKPKFKKSRLFSLTYFLHTVLTGGEEQSTWSERTQRMVLPFSEYLTYAAESRSHQSTS